MSDDSQIIVEPAGRGPQQQAAAWSPVVGPEAMDFLNIVVPQASQDEVRDAAVSILARAVPPAAGAGQETGLVVGYVQSGKTMSFETVAAMARDNAIQMVIVVAGISNPLLGQSRGRLRDDLRLDDPNRPRRGSSLRIRRTKTRRFMLFAMLLPTGEIPVHRKPTRGQSSSRC